MQSDIGVACGCLCSILRGVCGGVLLGSSISDLPFARVPIRRKTESLGELLAMRFCCCIVMVILGIGWDPMYHRLHW